MSVPNDTCTECCTCPTAIVEWDSRSGSMTDNTPVDPVTGESYLTKTVTTTHTNIGSVNCPYVTDCAAACETWDTSYSDTTVTTYDPVTGTSSSSYSGEGSCSSTSYSTCNGVTLTDDTSATYTNGTWSGTRHYTRVDTNNPATNYDYTDPRNSACPAQGGGTTTPTTTYSDLYPRQQFKDDVIDSLPAYDNDWNDTPGSYANLSSDGKTYSVRQSRYRFRFKVPRANSRSYRLSWVERFIGENGVPVSSIEVVSGGVYRPWATAIAIAGAEGLYDPRLVAVMSATGGVSGIRILNPGRDFAPYITFSGGGGSGAAATAYLNSSGQVESVVMTSGGYGYTSAPTVAFSDVISGTSQIRATGTAVVTDGRVTSITMSNVGNYLPIISVQAATNGGTSSTGWVASLTDGKLSSISGGSEGNYLPTLAISAPGGTGTTATATCTMDETGGIASVSVTSGGSKYTSEPTITITAKVTSTPPTVITPASLLLHMGTETARCDVWDKTTLADKWFTREVADGGHPLTSIEVIHGGHDFHTAPNIYVTPPPYLNTTVSAPPSGGTQAVIRANLNGSGRVIGFTIVQPGSGYISAPTITLPNPGAGNTQATGWVTNINGSGAVYSVTGGTQGDYSVAATASVSGKKITSITLTKYGWGFTTNPVIQISGSGSVATVLLAAHFGTEVEYADGSQPPTALPVGYTPDDPQTYPLLGESGSHPWKYYDLAVPGSNGTTLVANVRAICDGSSC